MELAENKRTSGESGGIDIIVLGKKLWEQKILIIKTSVIGLVISIIVAFSIPREYTTEVILAPESSSNGSMGVSALASMAGLNIGKGTGNNDLSSDIYPHIMESTPFILGLSKIQVSDRAQSIDTTFFSYIKDDQKGPWWGYILGIPTLVKSLFSSSKLSQIDSQGANKLVLTQDEIDVIQSIKDRIGVSIDAKTGVITLSSKMQSPEISASVADTLTSYLQSYVIRYRTEKARADLVFAEKLYNESKEDYTKAQQKYADYLDRNQNVILASYRVNQEKLQNEATLAYNVYNQVAQQLQVAKVQVQDQTPVYTIIQPAIIPLIPSSPNKKLIVVAFVFLSIVGACGWILTKDFLQNLKS